MYNIVDWSSYSFSKQLKEIFKFFIPQRLINKLELRGFSFYIYLLCEENFDKVTDTFKWVLKETHPPTTKKKKKKKKKKKPFFSWEICYMCKVKSKNEAPFPCSWIGP